MRYSALPGVPVSPDSALIEFPLPGLHRHVNPEIALRITPPIVGRLLAISRVMAHRRVVSGNFGAVHRRGIVHEVDLANVAACVGITFTPSQLAAAGVPAEIEEIAT
jgi:formate hydrogenlyase subunit 4